MTTPTLLNRTGTRAAADRIDEMTDVEDLPTDAPPAPGPTAEHIRLASIETAKPVGSYTDHYTTPAQVPLLDSLGGRLAFERGGVRLYDALLRKAEAVAHLQGLKDCIPDLEHIREEEAEHAELLQRAVIEADGDPTMETPDADLEGVMSAGLLQVVLDPRTTLLQCLRAAVVAELADVENWASLVRKATGAVSSELEDEIQDAFLHEQEHLELIRKWIQVGEGTAKPKSKRAR